MLLYFSCRYLGVIIKLYSRKDIKDILPIYLDSLPLYITCSIQSYARKLIFLFTVSYKLHNVCNKVSHEGFFVLQKQFSLTLSSFLYDISGFTLLYNATSTCCI